MAQVAVLHPGFGAVMDPVINENKPGQPESPEDCTGPKPPLPPPPVKYPTIFGKLPAVPFPLMGAIRIRMPGGPEVLEYRSVTTPALKEREVLIRVTAASVNKYDTMLQKGVCAAAPGDVIYPGLDCSGIVEALGPGATKWKVGDEVVALLSGGGYATKAVAHEDLCLPIPDGVTRTDAASLPEICSNIILSLFTYSCVAEYSEASAQNIPEKEKLRVLITGGDSGVGALAIQVAKAKGCIVYCTTSSKEKVVKCQALGAHLAINYKKHNFVDQIWKDTKTLHEPGVDMVLDVIGAPWTSQNLRVLKREGVLFVVGMRQGKYSDVLIGPVFTKQCSIRPAALRGQTTELRAEVIGKVKEHIWPLLEERTIRPVIANTFPLEKAVLAHRLMKSQLHFGKILLIADPEKQKADDDAIDPNFQKQEPTCEWCFHVACQTILHFSATNEPNLRMIDG